MVDDKVEMNSEIENHQLNITDAKNPEELAQYVQILLQSIQNKFQTMSEQILTRIDEMGNRLEDLEKNIAELMTQSGIEGPEK